MARSGVTGNGFEALEKFKRKLQNSPKVLEVVSLNMAEETISLIQQGFQDEKDPYGQAWEKLKRRHGRILQDTGRLRSSWHPKRIDMHGFKISAGVKYARFHQDGTRRMVARRMVPVSGQIPPEWMKRLNAAATEVLIDHFSE